MEQYISDLAFIAGEGERKAGENEQFRMFIGKLEGELLDQQVHRINDAVSAAIDCTQCGNCCKKLIINVTREEVSALAGYLQQPEEAVKTQYIEESAGGQCFINTIPCHFLAYNKCTIYEGRFRECRDFPHLHKPGFKGRFLGTLLHYGHCPIVYNVVEHLKQQTGFAQ